MSKQKVKIHEFPNRKQNHIIYQKHQANQIKKKVREQIHETFRSRERD